MVWRPSIGIADRFTKRLLPETRGGVRVTKPPRHGVLSRKTPLPVGQANRSHVLTKLNIFEKAFLGSSCSFSCKVNCLVVTSCRFSTEVLMFLWSNYLRSKYLPKACYVPGTLPVAGDTAVNQTERSLPSRKPMFQREETDRNKETKTRWAKALDRFRTITLRHVVSLVCHLLYNSISIRICLRERLNVFNFLLGHNFKFTENLPRQQREFPRALHPAFPEVSNVHNDCTDVKTKK